MKTVSFTEFRKNASGLFSEVENGESLLIVRHGKPIAEICPVAPPGNRDQSWRKSGLRLSVKGASLSAAILEERAGESLL